MYLNIFHLSIKSSMLAVMKCFLQRLCRVSIKIRNWLFQLRILFFCGEENFQSFKQLYFSGVAVMYSENIANLSLF